MIPPRAVFARLLTIALACWLLWALLIWQARPAPPAGVRQAVFLLSMVAGLLGCVWVCLPLFGRRLAGGAAGVIAFALILAVGHALGTAIATAAP